MPSSTPRALIIVKLGDGLPHLREHRGDFPEWITAGLGPMRLPVRVTDPRQGDPLPAIDTVAGAIVTGSHAMVTQRHDWSERTAQWLRDLVGAEVPVLGICYGHQLLAQAMGGLAEDHPVGFEAGTVEIRLTPDAAHDPLMRDLPLPLVGQFAHRQGVERLPPAAVRLASNDWNTNQAFRIGARAWGLQFHPEFDAEIARAYVQHLGDDLTAQGADVQALHDAVTATPHAAMLLGRFARLAQEHDAARG